MAKRVGNRTIILKNKPHIIGYGSVVGKKEYEGPLGQEFDRCCLDSRFEEETYEKAEGKLQKTALEIAMQKAGVVENDINMIFAGDLLNQCASSYFGLREKKIPIIGLYGACSTMTLGLSLASIIIDAGAADIAAAVTSSHFCSAERQYRFPLEYGAVRPQTAQWTVTGSGATILSKNSQKSKPYINAVCFGETVDLDVKDTNNMGAAMAPSAASTIKHFFDDTKTSIEDYDLVFTGDLGKTGTDLLYDLLEKDNINIRCRHSDCGLLIFNNKSQDVHSGGSGCGCSAAVLNSFVMHRFESGDLKNILFMSTGALMSPTTSLQGESIPGISHLVNICI